MHTREDTFTIHEVKGICDQCATTFIVAGEDVYTWRDSLGVKYSDLSGVRKYHDFLVVKTHDRRVAMKVRQNCYSGDWKDSPLRVLDATASGVPETTYSNSHIREISAEKMANMTTMYDRFIPPDRRPVYLPPLTTSQSTASSSTTSSSVTRQSKRKQSKCSTPGCDGSGHKDASRWAEGHKTRAGCPRR